MQALIQGVCVCVCDHISHKLLRPLQILHSQNKTTSDPSQGMLNDHLLLRAETGTALGLSGEAICEASERTCVQVPTPRYPRVGTLKATHTKLLDPTHPAGLDQLSQSCLPV